MSAATALIERHADEQAQTSLSHAFGQGINRREVIFGGGGSVRIDPPIFGMHDFQAHRSAARLAEAADARAARQAILLLRGKVKETQGQKAGTIRDPAQHLPPAAKHNLGQLHLALDRRPLSRAQLPQRDDPRAILVTQRQEEQQILSGLHAQGAQPQGERFADAAQRRHRLRVGRGALDHRATMHSTSTWAPRGNAATPTAARAG